MAHLKLFLINILMIFPFTGIHGQLPGHPDSLFTGYFRLNSGGWTAGDATISVPLPDGRTIWLFGDSYLVDVDTSNNTLPCLFQVRNCMVVQDADDPSLMTTYIDDSQTGVLRSTFKLGPNNPAILWPGHGFTDADTVYVYLDEIDGANMGNLGTHIAKLQLPMLNIIGIYPLQDYPGFQTGRAVLTDTTTGYRYIYCNKVNWIVWEPFVARTLIGTNILTPYQFYTGNSWSFDPNLAVPISIDPVSPGYSVIVMNDKYYLVTQENGYLTCGMGRDIYTYESDNPWGPFSDKTLVYTLEDTFNGQYLLTYNAQAHPSFTENQELLISYNLNDWVDTIAPDICPSQCMDIWHDRLDADTYRPKFIRVPFSTGVSVDVPESQSDKLMFPNPAQRNSGVRINGIQENCQIRLFDLAGRERGCGKITKENPVFTTPAMPGIYIVRCNSKGKIPAYLKLTVL